MSLTNLVSVPATNMDNIPDMHEEPNILNLNPCVNGFYASEEETCLLVLIMVFLEVNMSQWMRMEMTMKIMKVKTLVTLRKQ